MPAAPPLLKVTLAPPPDPRWIELFEAIEQNLEITVPDGFLTGGIGSSLPTSNIGPFLLNGDWYVWDDNLLQYVAQATETPVGAIWFFAFSAIDTQKWIICDGSAIPRAAPYDQLYAAIGTKFGNGDGSTTFNVPDLRGRAPIGVGTGMIPGNDTTPATTLTPRALGDVIGEETHALIAGELPPLDNTSAAKAATASAGVGYSATPGTPHNTVQPSVALTACIKFTA